MHTGWAQGRACGAGGQPVHTEKRSHINPWHRDACACARQSAADASPQRSGPPVGQPILKNMPKHPIFVFDPISAACDLLSFGHDEDFVAAYDWIFSGDQEQGSFQQVCVDSGYNPLALQESIRCDFRMLDRRYREIVTAGDGIDAQEFQMCDEDTGEWPL